MVRLLLYGYCVGVMSSRRIERATCEDLAFRYLAANQHLDHDTIAAFRQQHLPVLAQLFTQVLQLCDKAGLVKLGHVAIDGTKLQANASKHKAMSYERMEEKEKQLKAEVERLLAQAAETDAAEDARSIRAFLLRGLDKVQAEWKLICATHNLLKLFRSGYRPQAA